jgi:hypothetical protein
MLKKEAKEITGGLSAPSKMPGPSYNLPAPACITGSKLVNVIDSVCEGCYALKGRYNFPNVKAALARRLASLGHPDWIAAMIVLIKGEPVFRWHDSGDLQSPEHLKAIFEVCKATPETRHWLPTREARFLRLMDPEVLPKNLIIRFSSHMINQGPVSWWPWTSTVVTPRPFWKLGLWFNKLFRIKGKCFASIQGNKCLSCRACWNRDVKNVTYPKH